jgi:hypothetical protein
MRKYFGIVSRCSPSFDALEERALLSGGHPGSSGSGEMFWLSPPHVVHSDPMSVGRPQSDAAPWSHDGWAQSLNQFWPSQPGMMVQSEPGGGIPSQPVGNTASQPTVVGPLISSSSFSQNKTDSAPGLEIPSSIGAAPGSLATTAGTGQSATTESEFTGTISLDSQAAGTAGNSTGVGKESGPGPGGVSVGPSGLATTSPPAQLFSLLDADSSWVRLVSQGEALAGSDQLAGFRPGPGALTAIAHPGAAITSRGALLPKADVSTDPTNASNPNEWPRPSSADLLAHALPFDLAALDRAIDVFFHQFDDLNRDNLAGHGPTHIFLYSMALATSFAALNVVRKRWRLTASDKHVRVRHPQATADHVGFPELPGIWSSRPS